MNRNRVMRGLGLMALVLLAFGLAGCGSEPAPVARPPAPPPAPPPFQPQAVEVALGESGDTVTLMTAEGGGFTLNGEAFAGGEVESESGNKYLLALAEDQWTAAFQEPPAIEVMLGDHGGTVTIMMAEDGTFMIGEMAIESGGMVTGENDHTYTLTMDEEGMWMAAWVMPAAVSVMLGDHGGTVMLQMAEDGSYSIGETAIESGGMHTAENGNVYTLTMGEDGMWMAAYQAPPGIEVMLGDHGGTVTITMTEDGKYFIGEMEIMADTMVMGDNGHYYTPGLDDQGMWVAMWVKPAAVSVMLGDHGGTVMLQQAEDNSWWIGETAFASGENYMGANGQNYMLTYDMDSEMWMAMHMMPGAVSVMLGDHGGTVMLQQAEDNSWWIGETAFDSGGMQMGDNGHYYTLTYDMDSGMWMAMWMKPAAVMVALGTSGSTELQQAEDLSWWIGEMAVDSGDTTTASNGNVYTLSYDMETGMWSSAFMPASMEIMGTGGLMAMSREDGDGYDVGDTTLSESGMGEITVGGETYRVMMMDGALMGTRLDPVSIDGNTDFWTIGLSTTATIPGDEDDTEDVNEAMTTLKVAGDEYTFADLLADGMAEGEGDNFVAKAKEDLEGIRTKIEAIIDVFDEDEDRDTQIDRLWGRAASEDDNRDTNVLEVLEKVFGADLLGDVDALSEGPDDNDALEEIDKLILALSSVDGLAAALDEDGVLEGAPDGDMTAEEIFDATDKESTVSYGMVGMTRFGAVSKMERASAISDPKHTYDTQEDGDDGADSVEPGPGDLGAFAFGVTAETVRARHISTSGNAYYEGDTLAVDSDGTHYSGDISIRVRFATEKVDGLITNLETTDGDPWVYLFGDVESIVLPTADMNSATVWGGTDGAGSNAMVHPEGAEVTFALRAGSPRPQMLDSTFRGRLLGIDDDAGYQAVGTWSVGDNPDSGSYLAGGFGADRVSDEPDIRPPGDDGSATETKLIETTDPDTALADGMLTITVEKWGYERTGALGADGSSYVWGHLDEEDEDPDEPQENNVTRKYEIDLAALVAGEGAEYNLNGGNYVAMAKEMIEAERSKLASLLDSDQLPVAQANIWMRVQEILLVYVFNAEMVRTADAESDVGFDTRLPDQISGNYDADTALETIDDIIDALSTASNLEAALDKDEDGLFIQEDGETQFVTRGSGDIFGEKDSQVKVWIGTTDFTRFGVWRVRRSRNAQREGNWDLEGEMEAFAYSPLAAAKVTSTSSPNYTPEGMATYEGSTVAFVDTGEAGGPIGYEGDIDMLVEWNAATDGVGAMLTTVISNLQDAGTGDELMHNGNPVRDLVFATFEMDVAEDDDLLDFSQASVDITVEYMDRTRSGATGGRATTFAGMFVGASADGPLGVIGRYTIEEGTNAFPGDITGAFGAELP